MGLFPVNALHNVAPYHLRHLGYRGISQLILRTELLQGGAIIYAALAVMGIIPGLNTFFGLILLYGPDIWLHAVIAIAAAYFGFSPSRP